MRDGRLGKARYSHSGICVSDLERATAFYKEVFGFVDGRSLELHNSNQALLGIDGEFSLSSRFLRLGGLVIELLHWPVPGHTGDGQVAPLNRLGLTHLSFNVSDIDKTLADVAAYGGTVLPDTRSSFALPDMAGEIMFVTDPDGTRIEIMAFPEDVKNA